MAYKRIAASHVLAQGQELVGAMAGIGMVFGDHPAEEPNIEDTLLAASAEGMERGDLRVLAALVTWLGTHHPRVNADRLLRAVQGQPSERVRAFWSAVAHWLQKDRRLARLSGLYKGPRIELLRSRTDAGAPRGDQHTQRQDECDGERRGDIAVESHDEEVDPRFQGGPLRVPRGVLHDCSADIQTPEALAKRHRTYRCRVLIGPTYRADMWALLDRYPSISASELARRAYGSFATAWQVKHDRSLLPFEWTPFVPGTQ